MQLIKSLPRIAARVLHNTHVGRQNMKEKFELIDVSYGRATVEADFEKWCYEVQDKNPRYPLSEYIKVIDSRLGKEFEEKRADLKDPNIAAVASVSYEVSGFLPSVRSVGNLLLSFTVDELIGALREYNSTLEDKDVKEGMRKFFTEGGAVAVIAARKKREQK